MENSVVTVEILDSDDERETFQEEIEPERTEGLIRVKSLSSMSSEKEEIKKKPSTSSPPHEEVGVETKKRRKRGPNKKKQQPKLPIKKGLQSEANTVTTPPPSVPSSDFISDDSADFDDHIFEITNTILGAAASTSSMTQIKNQKERERRASIRSYYLELRSHLPSERLNSRQSVLSGAVGYIQELLEKRKKLEYITELLLQENWVLKAKKRKLIRHMHYKSMKEKRLEEEATTVIDEDSDSDTMVNLKEPGLVGVST